MAILSCLPGLKANVRVGGELAEEYDAPSEEVEARSQSFDFHKLHSTVGEETPYSLCYIEAKPGEPFEFVIDARGMGLQKPQMVELTAVLDGFRTHPELVYGGVRTIGKCLTGSAQTGFANKKFNFAALDILERPVPEKDIKKQIEEASNYGTLLVELKVVELKQRTYPSSIHIATPKLPVLEVAEKVLKGKAVDSTTTFQSEPIDEEPAWVRVGYADSNRRPFAIFEFRYRTMEGLIREFIVPRPEEVIDVEEEYMRIKRIKSEGAAEPRGIKREPVDAALFSARYKQRRLEDGKFEIDLTDD